ncbi:hypothetical protein [Parafrankia sp. EUN1f]|uniref:hypothetical protein n=1 Tax=Parafrankia sp. EUN1f TaxID=102897 RepID=UPI0012F71A24|nr:hypothetical protein [Parafrankia sp. EUN1f]
MPRDDQHRADAMLRGLVGGGRSRLSLSAAMRARDVAQLTDADLAWAEATVVLRHAYPAPPRPEPEPGAEPGAGPARGPGAVTDPGEARRRPPAPPGDQADASRRAASPPNVHPRPPGTADGRGRGRGTRPRPGSARPGGGNGQDAGAAGDASGSSPERS